MYASVPPENARFWTTDGLAVPKWRILHCGNAMELIRGGHIPVSKVVQPPTQ